MDSDAATARSSAYVGGGEATVSSFITFIILLAGVLGGLLIVVCVIIVCKYCVKSKKSQRGSLRGGRHDSGRPVRLLQRYETINSDVFSEPSSVSLDGIPLSPRKPLDLRNSGPEGKEEADERTRLCSLYDKGPAAARDEETGSQDSSGSARGRGGERFPLEASSKERTEGTPSASASGSQGQELQGHGSRRVSFQLDNVPHLASNAPGSGNNCVNSSRRISLQSSSRRSAQPVRGRAVVSGACPPHPPPSRNMHGLPASWWWW